MSDQPAGRDSDPVASQLRGLTDVLVIPPPSQRTVDAVMARLEGEPVPAAAGGWSRFAAAAQQATRWLRGRWRITTAVVVGAMVGLVLISPAGAQVRQWLGFGAVVVVQNQSAAPSGVTGPTSGITTSPAEAAELSLALARAAVSFPVGVPDILGEPSRITVADDGRLVTMEWPQDGDATIQLDQIGGAADPFFVKKYFDDIEFTQVQGREALWLEEPHPIVVVNPDGTERVESARQAGPALVWQGDGVTLRLEGVPDQQSAVAIAQSMTSGR